MPFQNYAGLRGQTQGPHPHPLLPPNDGLSTCGFIFTNIGMVGNSWLSPVNRHSFVRAALDECLRQPRGTKMIRFPPSPRDQPEPLATKSAHLLRLTRYPRPYPLFMKNRRRSTCGFVFALFGMVGGKGLNVVDGLFSWRALLPNAQKHRHGGGRCLRGGWGGWGWGLCSGSPPAARGLLAPGAASVPSAYGYPRPGLRRRPWR